MYDSEVYTVIKYNGLVLKPHKYPKGTVDSYPTPFEDEGNARKRAVRPRNTSGLPCYRCWPTDLHTSAPHLGKCQIQL